MSIGLKELINKYNRGSNFFRTILCRPEFNQFRLEKQFFVFDNSKEFILLLEDILKMKDYKCKNRRRPAILVLLLILLFNTQIAFCHQYEPAIIYSPSGEPQTMIKGKIIYDNYGVPKSHIQTKRGMHSVR